MFTGHHAQPKRVRDIIRGDIQVTIPPKRHKRKKFEEMKRTPKDHTHATYE